MSLTLEPGIYLTHKTVGDTSFSQVKAFKEKLSQTHARPWKVCHGGTLDPFAEGLLLLLVGPATHFFEWLHPLPKTYEAEVVWGCETDSLDGLGKPVAYGDAVKLSEALLENALSKHLGWQMQLPPPTSAKKIDGEPAYKKAHRGETFTLAPSSVYLHSAQWVSHNLPHSSRLRLTCRGGYYVRALARDVGRETGAHAHLKTLFRQSIGPWECPPPGALLQASPTLPYMETRNLTDAEWGMVRQGKNIPEGTCEAPAWPWTHLFPKPALPVLACHQNKYVALLMAQDNKLVPYKILPRGLWRED